jgi:hypothetical protein
LAKHQYEAGLRQPFLPSPLAKQSMARGPQPAATAFTGNLAADTSGGPFAPPIVGNRNASRAWYVAGRLGKAVSAPFATADLVIATTACRTTPATSPRVPAALQRDYTRVDSLDLQSDSSMIRASRSTSGRSSRVTWSPARRSTLNVPL